MADTDFMETQQDEFKLYTYFDPAVFFHDDTLLDVRNRILRNLKITAPIEIQSADPDNSQLYLKLVQVSNMISPVGKNRECAGYIACNSVLSGLYAREITDCKCIIMILLMNENISREIRSNIMRDIVAGFKRCAESAGAIVVNGPLVMSEYVWIGGVATSFSKVSDFMALDDAREGDILVLTKPLGTLIPARFLYYLDNCIIRDNELSDKKIRSRASEAYEMALYFMRSSNKTASMLMKQHLAHAAIDINGGSLLDRAEELARMQKRPLVFKFTKLPIINHTDDIDARLENKCNLLIGRALELSGGLLICFSKLKVDYIHKYLKKDFPFMYSVGVVQSPSEQHAAGTAYLEMNPEIKREKCKAS